MYHSLDIGALSYQAIDCLGFLLRHFFDGVEEVLILAALFLFF